MTCDLIQISSQIFLNLRTLATKHASLANFARPVSMENVVPCPIVPMVLSHLKIPNSSENLQIDLTTQANEKLKLALTCASFDQDLTFKELAHALLKVVGFFPGTPVISAHRKLSIVV